MNYVKCKLNKNIAIIYKLYFKKGEIDEAHTCGIYPVALKNLFCFVAILSLRLRCWDIYRPSDYFFIVIVPLFEM